MVDRVVPVRLPENLVSLIDETRKRRNAKSKSDPLTRSAWIREAIREKINHGLRGKKKKVGVKCHICKLVVSRNEVAYSEGLLTWPGITEYTCKKCDDYNRNKNQPPLSDHGKGNPSEGPADMG